MADEDGSANKKTHRKRQAGRKAEKKKAKNPHEQDFTAQQRNPKAFSYQSVNKVARAVRRTLDIREKKHHIPVVDRTPIEPPPVLVAVVGPPKVGKTTLIKCLIKNYTKQKLTSINGPVTIVSGKKRRLTIIECNNDINSMIDVAKVADLVLLLVDASFGFEMEIFEFLNICQVHGFPRIMGVLTHLDHFRQNKQLQKTKKRMKHRFWTEVYQGAKLFYLSGMVNGEYQRTEVHNLGRFISVMKFRPLQWRTTHPYILADRMEDVTEPEIVRQNPKVDRSVCLYGYVRGTHFKNNSQLHIPGCGDFAVHDMSFLSDPCPLPNTVKKTRSLSEKDRVIYAPMSGVGGIVYDKDAVYIDLGGSHAMKRKKPDEAQKPSNELLSGLIETHKTLDEKIEESEVRLFHGAEPIKHVELPEQKVVIDADGRTRRKAVFGDEGEQSEDDYDMESEGEEESEEEINSDEESDEDESFEQEQNVNVMSPKKKIRQSSESLVFADSDDELEKHGSSILTPNLSKRSKHNKASKEEDDSAEPSDESSEEDSENESDSNEDISDKDNKTMETNSVHETIKSKLKEIEQKQKELQSLKRQQDEIMASNDSGLEDEDDNEVIDEDMEQEVEVGNLRWKQNLAEKAQTAFLRRRYETPNLRKLVYGTAAVANEEGDGEKEADVGGMFKIARKREDSRTSSNGMDCSRNSVQPMQDWDFDEVFDKIRDCFVTGKWGAGEDAKMLLEQDDDIFGDFEDLETGQTFKAEDKEEEAEEDDKEESEEEEERRGPKTAEDRKKKALEKRLAKKAKMKAMFDAEYDDDGKGTFYDEWKNEMEQQAKLNRAEFENMDDATRAQYEGFRPGMYVRAQINNVPCELVTNFDASYPIILGGLLSAEQNIGYVHVRLKKHRWHKKILKTRDPLIISLGWRRFQSMVLFSIQDHNMRHRLLKYTPQHMHCDATFWGPMTPQGTGLLAVQSVTGKSADFRISATGSVLELDKSKTIVKKLKLTGTPYKIYRKTAFIEGMFNSALEVARFEGSSVRTVSGLRGEIKKGVSARDGKEGSFRATFEDKILLSDIVFIRTWYPVDVPQFYNTVTTLLHATDEKSKWQGMKTVGQLKRERGIHNKVNEDHLYKEIERVQKSFKPLKIPNELQKNLPFKDKPKEAKKSVDTVQRKRVAVIRDAKERKVAQLMRMLKTMHEHKMKQRRNEMRSRAEKHQKEQAKINVGRENKRRVMKKEAYRALGKEEARADKKRNK